MLAGGTARHSDKGIKLNDRREEGIVGFHCVLITYIPLAWWHHLFWWVLQALRRCAPSDRSGNGCDDPVPSASCWWSGDLRSSPAWGCHHSAQLSTAKENHSIMTWSGSRLLVPRQVTCSWLMSMITRLLTFPKSTLIDSAMCHLHCRWIINLAPDVWQKHDGIVLTLLVLQLVSSEHSVGLIWRRPVEGYLCLWRAVQYQGHRWARN